MAKKIQAYIKLQVKAAQANPSPPVGPALGQHGVNIMEFCKAFNARTQGMEPGLPTPVIITVYSDRSFRAAQEGCWYSERFRSSQQPEGRYRHPRPAGRDRQDQEC